jgi:hypothetical protein
MEKEFYTLFFSKLNLHNLHSIWYHLLFYFHSTAHKQVIYVRIVHINELNLYMYFTNGRKYPKQ